MDFDAARVAEAAGGRLVAGGPTRPGPRRAVIDSRAVGEGDLFVGLDVEHVGGGEFAVTALEAVAWGVLVAERHAHALVDAAISAARAPVAAVQSLAREWRRA